MIGPALRALRYPTETGLLVGLCFFLPLLEAPKNLLWAAYVVTWLVNRVRARDFGGRWDAWDSLIALWIASGYAAAVFAGQSGDEWRGAHDLLRYASVLWLVKRGGYSEAELRWVLGALVASTVVGLAVGYVRLWSGIGKSGDLQLHSVGHVNHTAIYLAIMSGVCVAWIYARWKAWRPGRRAAALAIATLVLASLIVTASRAAIAIGLAFIPLLGLAWWPRWRAPLVASAAALAVIVAAAAVVGAEALRKHEKNVAEQNVLSFRDGIWRMALAAWERYPLFGVGMSNYPQITYERVKTWRTEAGSGYDEKHYYLAAHAHNLYLNALAERGAIGAGALAAVLLAWLVALFRRRPRAEDSDHAWLAWGAAGAAWFVTVTVGLVNTTLHHEHGILAVLLLGCWLASRPGLRAPPSPR